MGVRQKIKKYITGRTIIWKWKVHCQNINYSRILLQG